MQEHTQPVRCEVVTRVLDRVGSPADLRALNREELSLLCAEIRDLLVHTTARTGGHLGPNLGAVEPWNPGSPCEIRVEFKHTKAADDLRFRPGVVRVDDRTITVAADTWWEAWKTFFF